MIRTLLPHGFVQLLDWQKRFRRVGVSAAAAWKMALNAAARNALVESRIEHLWPVLGGSSLELIVDVGTNQGQWLSAALHFLRPSRVMAFEPDPLPFKVLQQWAASRPRVELYQMALGESADELPLYETADSLFSSLLQPRAAMERDYGPSRVAVRETIRVPVRTLDSLLPSGRIDLLKLDVQGAERRVLSGAAGCLERTRVIMIETNFVSHYEGDDLFGDLCLLLGRHGFQFWTVSAPFYSPGGQALWADAVFVHQARSARLR
jgi:FkbM family methyltransferase